jgi:hypothetical protein
MAYTQEDLIKSFLAGGAYHAMPSVLSTSYLFAISEGDIVGHKPWWMNGYTAGATTTETDVWEGATSYAFPAAKMGMEVVSSDNTNDKAGGTGALTVTIDYLDDAYAPHSETVTLNGTTVVPTVAVDIFRVQSFRIATVGTAGKAAGNITLRHLSDTPVYAQIATGYTKSRSGIWTVPAGKALYITSVAVSALNAGADKGTRFTMRATYDADLAARLTAGVFFMPHFEINLRNGPFQRTFEMPIRFPEKVDIKMSALAEAASTICIAGLRGWYETP